MNHSFEFEHPEDALKGIVYVATGEKIAGTWSTPYHPEVGIFKLLAKELPDRTIAWANFLEQPDGRIGTILRGHVENRDQLDTLREKMESVIQQVTGVALRLERCGIDACTVNGKRLDITSG